MARRAGGAIMGAWVFWGGIFFLLSIVSVIGSAIDFYKERFVRPGERLKAAAEAAKQLEIATLRKSESDSKLAIYMEELASIPRRCVRTRGGKEDISGCDIFGIKLYTKKVDVLQRLERAGFDLSAQKVGAGRDCIGSSSNVKVVSDEFSVVVCFALDNPDDPSSQAVHQVAMKIDLGRSGRRSPDKRRMPDDWKVRLSEKYGPITEHKFGVMTWGGKNSYGYCEEKLACINAGLDRIEMSDGEFKTRASIEIGRRKSIARPQAKVPL
jgi:hypothetical protein